MPGISAILTAAGESRRMGRPKPLLPWRGTTLVEHQIDALFKGGVSEVVVVVGHEADAVAAQVSCTGARCAVNPDYLQGKTTSIKAGLHVPSVRTRMLSCCLQLTNRARHPSYQPLSKHTSPATT